MPENQDGGNSEALRSRLIPYLVKSAVIIAALFALSKVLPTMPIWIAALALAILSLVSALGSVYRSVVIRTFNQKKFGEGSIHKGRFLLRIPVFIGFYVLSAISMASILLESPTWGAGMWATVVLAIPLYIGTSIAVGWFVEKKEKVISLVKEARAARFSVIATGILLCIVFTAISFFQPTADYGCAADAFMAAPKPFEGSPSALVREVGDIVALVGGLSSYALAKLSESSWHTYLVAQVALNAASMLGVAGLLSVCLIEPSELKRAFMELEKEGSSENSRPVVKPFCIVFAVVPFLVVAGLVLADAEVQDPSQNEGYSFAKKFIRDQVSLIVYEFDGKYYNPEVASELLANAKDASEALTLDAEKTLVPLINESFDQRVANVDSYLDWYYGLFSDWEMLFNFVTGNAEDFAKDQLEAHIEAGIDDSKLDDAFKAYMDEAEKLREDTLAELSMYEITEEYPSWLVKEGESLDGLFETSLEPSERLVASFERIGISAVGGIAVGIIAKKVVSRVVAKSCFKAMVSRIGGLASASATASIGGPEAAAAAVVVGLAADIVMQKADEWQNREAYKQELINAIEEQREEMLSAVRAAAN